MLQAAYINSPTTYSYDCPFFDTKLEFKVSLSLGNKFVQLHKNTSYETTAFIFVKYNKTQHLRLRLYDSDFNALDFSLSVL